MLLEGQQMLREGILHCIRSQGLQRNTSYNTRVIVV